MSNLYSINLVILNNNLENITKDISIECLEVFDRLFKALSYINNLKEFEINETCHKIIKFQNIIPNNKDLDGLYIIYDKNINKFNIYIKKTVENIGYLYNTVNTKIDYIGFIEIIKSNISFNLNQQINQPKNELININNIINKKNKNKKDINFLNINKKLLDELKNKLDNINNN